ncbi:MAG: TetR/AcrR family transcriptional regulator, partial [Actinomycetota bacterium]
LKDRGSLAARADVPELAETVVAAIQGGYLLATTKKDIRPMRNATRAAYSYLRSFRPSSGS